MKKEKATISERAPILAQKDWNKQCEDFIIGRAPFQDISLRACRDRIVRELQDTVF